MKHILEWFGVSQFGDAEHQISKFCHEMSHYGRSHGVAIFFTAVGLVSVLVGAVGWWRNTHASVVTQTIQSDQAAVAMVDTARVDPIAATLIVAVQGAVVKPGVYQVQAGDRIASALDQAGGLSVFADQIAVQQQLNLATALKDGEKIYVPFLATVSGTTQKNTLQNASQSELTENKVSVNEATAAELEELPGIGVVTAGDIISNRPYVSLEQLKDNKVLTELEFQKIESLITI